MKRNETLTNGQQAFLDREIDTINRYEAAKKREHPSCPSDNNQVYLACMSKRLTPDEYAYYFMYIVRDYVGQNDPGYANRGGFECYKEFE